MNGLNSLTKYLIIIIIINIYYVLAKQTKP